MAKLPPRKRTKKSGGPVTTSGQLGMSKTRPKKNFKNSTKNKKPTGSSSKGSKPRVIQMGKRGNKGYNPAKTKNRKKTSDKRRMIANTPKKEIVLKKSYASAQQKDNKLMKKFSIKVDGTLKAKRNIKFDPTQLIDLNMLQTAISGLRKLPSVGKSEKKSLHDITDEDERLVYLQVTLCKLPKVIPDLHLVGPTTVSVYLPHSLATDNTDVILITKDLQRGIKRDHQNSMDHFKELLHKHEATSLVNEVIPFRQLKVEYKEFEAKRLLANRTDVLLCDDTVMRFIPKFLSKHFYTKKKLPVQVNLKAPDLQKELLRALSVSKLFFNMKGNSSIMKIGRMGQTDEEIQENILAAVMKLASHVPGKWANIQGLTLKLERTTSIPIYVNMDSLNNVKPAPARPLLPGEPVSGTLSTIPGRYITVFPDGSVTATKFKSKVYNRIPEEERNVTKLKTKERPSKVSKKQLSKVGKKSLSKDGKKSLSKDGKKSKGTKKSLISENGAELPEMETEVSSTQQKAKEKNNTKRKVTEKTNSKAKKQKKALDSDSDSGEEDLEEQEMMYLRQLNQRQEESTGNQKEEEEEDVWADSESDMEESD